MYKKQFTERQVRLRTAIIVHNENPNLSDKEKEALKQSEEWKERARMTLVSGQFVEKIADLYGDSLNYGESKTKAINIINAMPQELWPNIEEWIDDQPISDIKVHGVSIPDIMNQFMPDRKIDFLEALKCLSRWKEIDYQIDNYCLLYFLRM